MSASPPALKKVLGATHLWAIAVGLVISGEYFGWNYGWKVAGTTGMLIATGIVTILYVCFVFSFTELSTAIPQAGGPFTYACRALGPLGGFVAGYATLIEFILAAPAIAFALGAYLHFLYPALNITYTALGAYVIFTGINLIGIRESALFTLAVTILAVAELLLYSGIVAPHFDSEKFLKNDLPFGIPGIFAALPFAIWFYLAIEGVAMVAEEARDPRRSIPRGYIAGMLTLVVLALAVMILTGGVGDWNTLASIDYPLPASIGIVLGENNRLTKLFAGIGLFGLIASFHSIIIGYSRQVFAQAREGYLPRLLSVVHPRTKVPHMALLIGALVGGVAVLSGKTDQLIVLSAMGAVVMYIVSMISLFVLRRKEPGLERPFRSPFYPWFPGTALLLSGVCLGAIIYYNGMLALIFFGSMALAGFLFYLTRAGKLTAGPMDNEPFS